MSHFETPDINHVRDKFQLTKEGDHLSERLGKANTKRRQLLKYNEMHHEKLVGRRPDDIRDEKNKGEGKENDATQKPKAARTYLSLVNRITCLKQLQARRIQLHLRSTKKASVHYPSIDSAPMKPTTITSRKAAFLKLPMQRLLDRRQNLENCGFRLHQVTTMVKLLSIPTVSELSMMLQIEKRGSEFHLFQNLGLY